MQRSVDTIYATFKRRVAVGRKMDVDLVDSFAQGRVWTGTDAMNIGLVDKMGNLNRAIASAAAKAHISDYRVVTYPERVDKMQSIIRRLKMASISTSVLKAEIQKETGAEYELIEQLKSLPAMNGRAMMYMPFRIEMK